MIRKSDLQRIVTEALSMQASGEVGYETPLAMDSFSFAVLQHLLEERHGIELEPERAVLQGFASVRDIHLHLAENFPADVEAPMAARAWWGEDLLGRESEGAPLARIRGRLTRGGLRSGARELAGRFRGAGIGPGASVAVYVPPGFTLMQALVGLWSVGAQVILIDARTPPGERERLFALCEPQFVVAAAGPEDGGRGLVEESPLELSTRPGGRPADEDICLVQFTSGSTGVPKVIGRTGRSLRDELVRYASLDGMPGRGERILLLNSLVHTVGLVGGFLHALSSGAELVFPVSTRIGAVLETGREADVHAVFGIPFHFDLLSRASGRPLRSLRVAMSAGEPLPEAAYDRFLERYGVPVGQIYGMTETGMVTGDLTGSRSRAPWVGRPAGDTVELKSVESELYVRLDRSPYLYGGAGRYSDGWLRTYDRCALDESTGALAILGRLDSVTTVGGMKVDLAEIEGVLREHPAIQEAVVVHSGAIEAYVGGAGLPPSDELIRWCRRNLSPFKVPKVIFTSAALPRNRSGKILRNRDLLRSHAWD
ncbi:class I adenylate-forming enzyme family protein [Streptomyces sp. NPDC059788]|uniref:class I adenylate-forming enzyme family protein n=1 Tax=Streptomyces sp. NPDC059788 TaxID=3346948 RepID=UPI0036620C33